MKRVTLVEHELFTLPDHLTSLPLLQQTPKFYFFLTICVFIHESSLNTVHPTALNRLIQSIELRGLYIVVKRVFTSIVYKHMI
jgi:hypothetical protein